jgi:hypothetical protein
MHALKLMLKHALEGNFKTWDRLLTWWRLPNVFLVTLDIHNNRS